MFKLAGLLGLVGLAAATAVIAWSGADQVYQALQQAGWGILWSSLSHLIAMILCVLGWQALLPGTTHYKGKRATRPGRLYFMYLLWLRSSINNLMPVARVGGEIVAVRVMIKHGMRKSSAIACTVVETTLSVIAQFVFVLMGVALFLLRVSDENMMLQMGIGLGLSLILIGALVFVQKIGFFGMVDKLFAAMLRDKWKKFAGSAARLDQAVRVMYKRKGRALWCLLMQFASWAFGAVEIWLALYFLGHNVSLDVCLIIEALIQGTGSAAFLVPGAIGVQEAGFLLFGHFLGFSPEIAAALAVMRRCRDLILYIPGLMAWQIQEGRWLLQKKARLPEES